MARLDCNRGRGTWKTGGTDRLELGPLAITRAMCPSGSLHDPMAAQWGPPRGDSSRGYSGLRLLGPPDYSSPSRWRLRNRPLRVMSSFPAAVSRSGLEASALASITRSTWSMAACSD